MSSCAHTSCTTCFTQPTVLLLQSIRAAAFCASTYGELKLESETAVPMHRDGHCTLCNWNAGAEAAPVFVFGTSLNAFSCALPHCPICSVFQPLHLSLAGDSKIFKHALVGVLPFAALSMPPAACPSLCVDHRVPEVALEVAAELAVPVPVQGTRETPAPEPACFASARQSGGEDPATVSVNV